MIIFLGIMIVAIAAIIAGVIYILRQMRSYAWMKKLCERNKALGWIVTLIPVLIIGIFLYLDVVNTLVVVIHIIIIWLIVDGIRALLKIGHKQIQSFWSALITLAFCICYLGYGYYNDYHVVVTRYHLSTDKKIGENLRIVQISDSHIGATFHADGFKKHLKTIAKLHPDVIVITGDYVDDDTSKKDMVESTRALGKLKTKHGIYYVYGNHDKGLMNYRNFSTKDLAKTLKQNHIHILEDETVSLGKHITIAGRQDDMTTKNRKSAEALMRRVSKNQYSILLDHEPTDYENEQKTNADLVLSGHTHGGQMFPIGITGELSGANDMTYGMKKIRNTTFIVNSAISDWATKFKTGGAISEIGVIDIKQKS